MYVVSRRCGRGRCKEEEGRVDVDEIDMFDFVKFSTSQISKVRRSATSSSRFLPRVAFKPPNGLKPPRRLLLCSLHCDYHLYLAEFASGGKRKDSADKSLNAYKPASGVAVTELPPTHPIHLGLALNFSVFYFEYSRSHVPSRQTSIR